MLMGFVEWAQSMRASSMNKAFRIQVHCRSHLVDISPALTSATPGLTPEAYK